MRVIRSASELQAWRKEVEHVALVPTMGYLHQGHLSLVAEAKRRRDLWGAGAVAMSIFVNPTQFGPNEDFSTYPRDEEGDFAKARAAGVDLIFCPQDEGEIYPQGKQTWVEVVGLDQHLCGAGRMGHFRGVCTVVMKLWQLFLPRCGVFGEKDYQQLAILKRMHADLFLCGEVVGHPIVREADGLAMSSRNARLSEGARGDALQIFAFLQRVKERLAKGEREVARLVGDAEAAMSAGELEYCAVVDAATLQPLQRVEGPARLAVAVRYGGVRLIDNAALLPDLG